MPNKKKLWVFALILFGIGGVGSLMTYSTSAKQLVEEEFDIDAANIEKLEILSRNARVELLSTSESKTKIKIVAEGHYDQLLSDVDGDTLTIEMKEKRYRFRVGFFNQGTSLKMYVPKKLYDDVSIKNRNGRVVVNDIKVKDMNVEGNNGKMILNNVDANVVDVETNNGSIQLKQVAATTIYADTDNGGITFDRVEGEVIGETNNGSVTMKTTNLDRSINLQTNNGRITIETDEKPTNAVLDLKTSNGTITVFDEKDWGTIIGSGDHLIKLKTDNGKITISH